MSKKWWLALVALVALAVALVIAIPVLLPPSPGVTYKNYSRIDKGMTRAQVFAILGKPSVNQEQDGEAFAIWHSENDDDVRVVFNDAGRVECATWNDWPDERSGLQKLMDRLPWISKPSPPPQVRIITVR